MNALTPPTPENVAEMLTDIDGDFHDGNDWWPGISRDGNVVEIEITPVGDDYETKLPARHFRAVVVEVPAYGVAAEPVTIDGGTARELAYSDPEDDRVIDGWTVVANEHIGQSSWASIHRLVIRNEQGEHFADTYSKGLTEHQSTGAYEDADIARFTPVVPKFKVVTDWTEAAQAQKGGTP